MLYVYIYEMFDYIMFNHPIDVYGTNKWKYLHVHVFEKLHWTESKQNVCDCTYIHLYMYIR